MFGLSIEERMSKKIKDACGKHIDAEFVRKMMYSLKCWDKLNLKANPNNPYGFVIYPK